MTVKMTVLGQPPPFLARVDGVGGEVARGEVLRAARDLVRELSGAEPLVDLQLVQGGHDVPPGDVGGLLEQVVVDRVLAGGLARVEVGLLDQLPFLLFEQDGQALEVAPAVAATQLRRVQVGPGRGTTGSVAQDGFVPQIQKQEAAPGGREDVVGGFPRRLGLFQAFGGGVVLPGDLLVPGAGVLGKGVLLAALLQLGHLHLGCFGGFSRRFNRVPF